MRERDIVVGQHSIEETLKNPLREHYLLVTTPESLQEFAQKTKINPKTLDLEIKLMPSHEVQEEAKKLYSEFEFTYHRVPSNMFLVTSPLPLKDLTWLMEELEKKPSKILCLDQVTDAHNAAAILRTAAFFGVDALMVSMKGSFGAGPQFHRIASGASEFIPIVKVASLPRALTKLQNTGVLVVGLSEHATPEGIQRHKDQSLCLVLGAEDLGLSHAVSRILTKTISLQAVGPIKSLNVSVAAALAMEKFFSPETT